MCSISPMPRRSTRGPRSTRAGGQILLPDVGRLDDVVVDAHDAGQIGDVGVETSVPLTQGPPEGSVSDGPSETTPSGPSPCPHETSSIDAPSVDHQLAVRLILAADIDITVSKVRRYPVWEISHRSVDPAVGVVVEPCAHQEEVEFGVDVDVVHRPHAGGLVGRHQLDLGMVHAMGGVERRPGDRLSTRKDMMASRPS